MPLEVEATYEDGVLKPDKPLPLNEHVRVTITVNPLTITVNPQRGGIRDSAGLVKWTGDPTALEFLLGPDNSAWDPA